MVKFQIYGQYGIKLDGWHALQKKRHAEPLTSIVIAIIFCATEWFFQRPLPLLSLRDNSVRAQRTNTEGDSESESESESKTRAGFDVSARVVSFL